MAFKTNLKRFIESLIEEEFAPSPKMGDINPTPEDDQDRPGMNLRPDDGMEVEQHHKMMRAEGNEEEESESLEEMSAIGGGGAGMVSTGQVSATSSGNAWKKQNPEHDLMWAGDKELSEELIGTSKSGVPSYFQMGSSLPNKFYNKDNKTGKSTRDPGVMNMKKESKKPKAGPSSSTTVYFKIGDDVLYGKYKNKRGKVVGFSKDDKGNPTMEIEPTPKGKKKNQVIGLYRIWRADIKDKKPIEEAYYHGTTADLQPGDDILPPSMTGKQSEADRKKNLDKVFVTKDLGSAKIYAGRAKHSLGGKPKVYLVEPAGDMEVINANPGTTVFAVSKAKIIKKLL